MNMMTQTPDTANMSAHYKPSGAFVGASWVALGAGMLAFIVGLWNVNMQLNEKGYYFTVLMYGLFAAVSVQKSVRDRLEGIPVSNMYYGLAWMSVMLAILLLAVGLWNAKLADSEKGFYGMAFLLGLFGAIAVQKNVRDLQAYHLIHPSAPVKRPAPKAEQV
jgi:uncharacterized membrane protein YiaA